MSKKQFGYIGAAPTQSFANLPSSNTGVFNIDDINFLKDKQQYPFFGQLELIQTQVASAVNNLDFLNIKEDIYNVHFVTFNDIQWGTADTFYIRVSDDGGSTFESSNNYYGAQQYGNTSGSFGGSTRNPGDKFDRILQNQNNLSHNGYVYLYNLGDSEKYSFLTQHTINWSSGHMQFKYGSHTYNVASRINALRFYTSTHAWSGSISLYGIRFS
tara:strand:- start:1085 stop:1726 length:642 start_codon:yes stop_codon:yes gene_type:complete